jgi:hypothetical protein
MKRAGLLMMIVGCESTPAVPPAAPAAPLPTAAASPARADAHAGLVETQTFEAGSIHLQIEGSKVSLAELPVVDWVGLPMTGTGSIHVDLRIPVAHGASDLSNADGVISLGCMACQLGDDVAKLRPPVHNRAAEALIGDGIAFGHVAIERAAITVRVQHGQADITEWTVTSPDLDVVVSGHWALGRTYDQSTVEACIRFGVSPGLRDRDPRTDGVLRTTGATLGGDGRFNIRVAGQVSSEHLLAQVCDGSQPLAPLDGTSRPDLPPPAAEKASNHDDEADAIMAAAIKMVDDQHYVIGRALVAKLIENPISFSKRMRVVPAVKDGKAAGLKLYAIRPDSLWDRLGFRNGDTLVAINGSELATPEKALEIYTKLRDSTSIAVDIERRGKSLTLHYEVR